MPYVYSRIAIGIGVGTALGVASVYLLYRKLRQETEHRITHLCSTILTLQQEIDELRKHATWIKARVGEKKRGSFTSDESDDEFFDLTDVDEEPDKSAYDTIDELLNGTVDDQLRAHDMLVSLECQKSDDVEFLWRMAKATRSMGTIQGDKGFADEKKDMIFKAFGYAKRALDMDDTNPYVHLWYAITLGMQGEYISIKEKIKNGYEFKEHIDIAARLNPTDSSIYHLLGRFSYEVSSLSWMESKIAAALFATPPTSSFEEALKYFLRSEELKEKPWKENKLFIAKCYIQKGDYKEAAKWLGTAADIKVLNSDDSLVHKEVMDLLGKYSSYLR